MINFYILLKLKIYIIYIIEKFIYIINIKISYNLYYRILKIY